MNRTKPPTKKQIRAAGEVSAIYLQGYKSGPGEVCPYPIGSAYAKIWLAARNAATAKGIPSLERADIQAEDALMDAMTYKPPPSKPRRNRKDLESTVKRECMKAARSLGCFIWPQAVYSGQVASGWYLRTGIVGCADIVGVMPGGKFLEIECKRRTGGTQSSHQISHQIQIKKLGGVYIVAHSGAECLEQLRRLL